MNYVGGQGKLEDSQLDVELLFTKLLVNQAVEAAFCLGPNARFLYVNDATCRATGYSRQELLAMALTEIDPDLDLVWSKRWRSLQRQGHLTINAHCRTKAGQIFPVVIRLTHVREQGREFGCAFAEQLNRGSAVISNDTQQLDQEISKLKHTEAELETSLALLRSTLDSTAYGIVAVGFSGEILSFNQKFVEMWQLPDFVTPSIRCDRCKAFFESQLQDPDTFRRVIWEVSSQSDFESYDILKLKDGRTFSHYSKPQRVDGKIIGRVWSVWDITESQQTEQALRQNEARFRTLAEGTDAIIFILQGIQLCYVNPVAETLTGYTRAELLGSFDLRQLIKLRKRRQIRQQDEGALPEYEEVNILTKNGTERWLACSVTLLEGVLDFAGKPVEMITAIDITDYKQAEAEVSQALEQAKQLSELRAQFVLMVCHQLRTPLNVVSFSTSLLRRHLNRWSEEAKQPYLDHIQTAVEQINQLLNEFLLFGQTEAAKLMFEPSPTDLDSFCRDLIAQTQISCDREIVTFTRSDNCSTAPVDKKLLQPILMNLLSNAIKYSPPDGLVNLDLSCQGQNIFFQVKDAGIGIPLGDQQRLFEPFQRGSNVEHIPGTGLGLSIVKTLVDLHGGQIAVVSQVGLGTTVTVMLPANP